MQLECERFQCDLQSFELNKVSPALYYKLVFLIRLFLFNTIIINALVCSTDTAHSSSSSYLPTEPNKYKS